nr:non-ribosomal peptide synthetase [uncultured Chitinophaga sp.]
MSVVNLIKGFKEKGIDISLSGNDLKIDFDGNALTDSLLAELKINKANIIDFLKKMHTAKETGIPAAAPAYSYPLSSSQRRLWVLSQFEEGSIAYNMPGVFVFEGELNQDALKYSFNRLLERHESLRTVFREGTDGDIHQFILMPEETGFNVCFHDLRNNPEPDQLVKQMVQEEFVRPFDLEAGPLLRADLYQTENSKWLFTCTMHHIVSDGWSMRILIRELLQFYNAFASGRTVAAAPLRIHYKDYAVWQQSQLSGAALQDHRTYWLEQFAGALPTLELPADYPRPAVKTYNGGLVHKTIGPNLFRSFRSVVQEQDASLFMGLLSVVNILLYHYSGQEDIVIGSPIAGREHMDLEDQIGFYANTLALRTRFSGGDGFNEILALVKRITLGAYEHQVYPFDDLVEELDLVRDMSRNALFDVMVALQNTRVNSTAREPQRLDNIRVSGYEGGGEVVSKFDLTFNFTETGSTLQLGIEYNSDIYRRDTIAQLASHFEQLLEAVSVAPSAPVQQLEYLSDTEKQQLLTTFNDTRVNFRDDETLISLFEEQAARAPQVTALVFEGRHYSYRELNEKVNQLAHHLRTTYAVVPDDRIGIKMDRSERMIIALLAAMKSGGAYVPIDPAFPAARINYLLEDSQCKVLIDEAAFAAFEETAAHYSVANPEVANTPSDLAYVIYTSGSTGQPKGCMLEHRGVVNRIGWMWQHYGFTPADVILQKTTFTFDVSVWELFMPLCWGARMVLCHKDDVGDPQRLLSLIEKEKVTCLHFVPSMFSAFIGVIADRPELVRQLTSLRGVMTSGEALPAETVAGWYQHSSIPVHNLYGPTEASVDVTYYTTAPGDTKVPIGRPIWNTSMYILGAGNQLVPAGVKGEICIGGIGLARGYLHQPALTAEKFVPHPFLAGERLYKTGDLGRWLPDGNIEYLGRKDDQVKIRGYRIELGEIEAALLKYPGTEAAVVVAKHNAGGDKELVAYVVNKSPVQASDLKAYLGNLLPAYMVPAYYMQVNAFPLTANGKLDRKQLPAPDGAAESMKAAFAAPANKTEAALLAIWQNVLWKDGISVLDNFFDLGGHSLKATRLASQIHKAFDVRMSLKDLFAVPVLREQAAFIANAKKAAFVAIPLLPGQPDYALSSSQQRLWTLSRFENANISYNISGNYVFEGRVDLPALHQAFGTLIERHEILRTIFTETAEGTVRQTILPPGESGFQIDCRDLRTEPEKEAIARKLVKTAAVTPFDLSIPSLLRVGLYRLEEEKWVFTYVLHHIISDGWSMDILINELLLFYRIHLQGKENPLAPLRIQYKDYAAWQQQQVNSDMLNEHAAYWLKQFEGELPVLEMPADKVRPALKTYNGGGVTRRIPAAVSRQLKNICQEEGSTFFMGLLSAVKVLLYRYTGQEDITVGCPVAGRSHADLEDQVGFYVNTLALRTRFSGGDHYRQLLDAVKQTTLKGHDHQLYPFDKLVDTLQYSRDMSRNPLFDVMVILKNAATGKSAEEKEMRELKISGYHGEEHVTVKVDLSFDFIDTGADLVVNIAYNSDIYEKSSISRLADHLEHLVAAIVKDPALPICELPFLGAAEREQLLLTFNNTQVPIPTNETVLDMFERQVTDTPDKAAVVYGDVSLTYRELNDRAAQLANYLYENYHIKPDDLIALKLKRDEWMVISILAVLKSGGAYVPIDPEYPADRVTYLLQDSQCKVLVDQAELEKFMVRQDAYCGRNTERVSGQHHLAYVIYTSGTTGHPKGVMIEHRSLYARMHYLQQHYGLTAEDNFIFYRSYSFDGTLEEYMLPLVTGATCFIAPPDFKEDIIHNIIRFVAAHRITKINMPPVLLGELLHFADGQAVAKMASLKTVVSGGDKLTRKIVNDFLDRFPARLYNAYGPPENTNDSTGWLAEKGPETMPVPIGRPVHNSRAYILDGHLQPVPTGIYGELFVGGIGLSRGYLNRAELTAEKFLPDPFVAGEKMYRTGDLCRWLPDGNIEFAGRTDFQVKIRGYRIELGEIENALQQYEGVKEAVVAARNDGHGEKVLVAYLVGSGILDTSAIQSYLHKLLPAFMVPAYYLQLDALPLTAVGKRDLKRLPAPEGMGQRVSDKYVASRNETEEKLVAIWEEVLSRTRVGIHDNFFLMGGNSINLIRLSIRINKVFGRDEQLKTIFQYPTPATMAAFLQETGPAAPAADTMEKKGCAGCTTGCCKAASALHDISYNMQTYFPEEQSLEDPMVMQVAYPEVDIAALKAAIAKLVERHDTLRTVFVQDGTSVKQRILPPEECNYEMNDTGIVTTEQDLDIIIRKEYLRKFDLMNWPLFAVNVYRLETGPSVIIFTMHHIIGDGHSIGVLKEELVQLYREHVTGVAASLPPLRHQYRDFSNWQRAFVASEAGHLHRQFWLEKLSGFTPEVRFLKTALPVTHTKRNGICLSAAIEGALYEQADHFAKTLSLTRTALLLGVLDLVLYKWTGQKDITLLTRISGRDSRYYGDMDVSSLIGFFVNTVLVRNEVDAALPVQQFLKELQQRFLDDLHYSTYPFGKLTGELPAVTPADFLRSTVVFNYHNYDYLKDADYHGPVKGGAKNTPTIQTALVLHVHEFRNCLRLDFICSRNVFDQDQASAIKALYLAVLRQVIQEPDILPGALKTSLAAAEEVAAR